MAHAPHVPSITSAPRSPSEDSDRRLRRYLVTMGIRMVCLVLAVVFMDTFWMWVFAAGAVLLPWFAVVLANARTKSPADASAYVLDASALPSVPQRRPWQEDAGVANDQRLGGAQAREGRGGSEADDAPRETP